MVMGAGCGLVLGPLLGFSAGVGLILDILYAHSWIGSGNRAPRKQKSAHHLRNSDSQLLSKEFRFTSVSDAIWRQCSCPSRARRKRNDQRGIAGPAIRPLTVGTRPFRKAFLYRHHLPGVQQIEQRTMSFRAREAAFATLPSIEQSTVTS